MNKEQLNSLAKTDLTNFIPSENNVKYKIVIPFLQAFNHVNLDLEHAAHGSRIDINIGNRIIVETKALGQNINIHVQQLSDYSGKELPVLAILTNGKHFRIYSPQWRYRKTFADKVIYEFELKDLTDTFLLNRLEKILDFSNYESEEFIGQIEEREREIIQAHKEIENIKTHKAYIATELQNEINELKEKSQEINEQIKSKEQIIADIRSDKIPEILAKKTEVYYPINIYTTNENLTTLRSTPILTKLADAVGDKFRIENKNKGVRGYGQLLPNGNFLVLAGSVISNSIAPKFETSLPSAFRKRQEYLNEGTIDTNLKFTRDVEFSSKSSAASVILGDSSNGNKMWIRE